MRVRRLLLTVIAAATVAVAVTAIVHTARTFYRLDFALTWVDNGFVVGETSPGSSAERAGLKPGDMVVAVDAVGVEKLEDPVFALATGEQHRLGVLDSAGELREVSFTPPPPVVDSVYLARSAVAMVGLGCAIAALYLTRRRELTTFVLLAVASLLVAVIPVRTAAAQPTLAVLHRMASAAVPFLLLRFFWVFPERGRRVLWWDAVTVLAVAGSGSTTVMPRLAAWWPVAASALRILFAAGLLGGIGLQIQRWGANARDARSRRQIEWAALGLFVGLLPYCTLVLLPRWLGIAFEPFSWLGVLPLVAVPFGFLAALAEYRLWDLEPISRDAISATLATVSGGLVFALINKLLVNYGGSLGALRNLLVFATGVLVVVLVQPLRSRVARFLDQWIHHGRPAPRSLLTHSARDLASATDAREVLTRLSATLVEGLEVELAATYLREASGSFVRVTGAGEQLPPALSAQAPAVPFPSDEEAALAAGGYALRLPLARAGTVHGLLYLGLRRGSLPLGSEGQEVVSAFAAQAALALESARRLDDLRRQAEEYRILHANTQRIIESSAAAILVCDAGGRILSANSRAAAVLGQETQALVGEPLGGLVELPAGWHPHLPLYAANAEVETATQPPRRVILAVSVLELDSGSFNGRVVVMQDVSELRELQDKVREQERLAALGRLASGLAHEINTPLTGIASFAQMLGEMTPASDPRGKLVSKLVEQSFRVSRIVANLREAVRGSRDGGAPLDLRRVVEHAAADAARSLFAADRLKMDASTDAVMVVGAVGPVELAVSNLVRNAVEASPAGSPVRVAVTADGDWGVVEVDDCGPGVPEELREKVFEPFFSTKTARGGTGLGLAITRDMITQLGGEVTLQPSPTGGTRAIIRLKRWQAPAQSS